MLELVIALVAIGGTIFYFGYKAEIQKEKEKVKKKLARGLVYRDSVSKPDRVIKALELHPAFFRKNSSTCQMCSLGEYLTTLHFFTDDNDDEKDKASTTKMFENELRVVMAALMMRALGETTGAAFLPMLGMKPADSMFHSISSKIVSYVAAKILVTSSSKSDWDPMKDLAAIPFNVDEILSILNLYEKTTDVQMEVPPLTWMERGEIAYDPTYHTPTLSDGNEAEKILIPNPFVIEDHFDAAILGLEERIRASELKHGDESTYDPNDRSNPKPTPINHTILPDLYLGWGDLKLTHTQRERQRNRLFAVLLTKLSHNYEKRVQDQDNDYFVVRMDGSDCIYPDEFIQALCDSGHSIEVCPRSTITTFGMAACVKESDGSWTNIPIAFFLRTGYESRRQRPAYYHAIHGGIDMTIKGPLVGTSNKCDIQFYMAIDGMCGWHSNYNVDAPWMEQVSASRVYTQEEALTAVRMGGVLACAFNQIGTEMDLPFGGYGVMGVCNDTAALVDFAVRGTTNMYPLISTGRFMMHLAKFFGRFSDGLLSGSGADGKATKVAAAETLRLAAAACKLNTDIHCSPKQMVDAARRYEISYPSIFFQINEDSRNVMKEVLEQYINLNSKLPKSG